MDGRSDKVNVFSLPPSLPPSLLTSTISRLLSVEASSMTRISNLCGEGGREGGKGGGLSEG